MAVKVTAIASESRYANFAIESAKMPRSTELRALQPSWRIAIRFRHRELFLTCIGRVGTFRTESHALAFCWNATGKPPADGESVSSGTDLSRE